MVKYSKNNCGPVYIMVGSGGNVEGLFGRYVDDIDPGSHTSVCELQSGQPSQRPGLPAWTWTYVPYGCPTITWQPAAGSKPGPGLVPGDVVNGQQLFYCQSSQPRWSAYRSSVVGFGGLSFLSDTQASWSFYRVMDQKVGSSAPLAPADSANYTRWKGQCGPS